MVMAFIFFSFIAFSHKKGSFESYEDNMAQLGLGRGLRVAIRVSGVTLARRTTVRKMPRDRPVYA
mgnify:CR=1 FL=1